ncbi:MAG: DUF6250 domain-containing protein [Marinifilum sp.]|jgi:hypothetical protein|nr:DUF6250 domain-containing protein [Marinifilum sp.]
MKNSIFFFIPLIIFVGIFVDETFAHNDYTKTKLLFQDDFETLNPNNWVLELQSNLGFVGIKNEKLEIDVPKGVTIWFKHRLKGNILIEYDAVVIDQAGPNDRVSDLNCFWMATDPRNPKDIFNSSRKPSGKFQDYDTLRLYYVGLGGHANTKTRFRRYDGTGSKPLLKKHDLSSENVLIEANKTYRIRLVAMGNQIRYYRDNHLIYDFVDEYPYRKGWFGIRTINNHMKVDNLKIYRIKKNNKYTKQ